jgi:hypothetical protein
MDNKLSKYATSRVTGAGGESSPHPVSEMVLAAPIIASTSRRLTCGDSAFLFMTALLRSRCQFTESAPVRIWRINAPGKECGQLPSPSKRAGCGRRVSIKSRTRQPQVVHCQNFSATNVEISQTWHRRARLLLHATGRYVLRRPIETAAKTGLSLWSQPTISVATTNCRQERTSISLLGGQINSHARHI